MTLNGKRHGVLLCPKCSYEIDLAAMLDDDRSPEDGDFSVCVACAAVCVFEDGMTVLRLATLEEQDVPGVKTAIATVLESWR